MENQEDGSMKGYVQVYTGNGKGKTTAAMGLALRAAGAGLTVYIAQFLKKGDFSEMKALRKFSESITVEQFGQGRFIRGEPAPSDVAAAETGLGKVKAAMASGRFDVMVLDEANGAVEVGLFPISALIALIDEKPDALELVITGRSAHEDIIRRADLVTEMRAIKHYFDDGVAARVGIEK
jgi:cob(I)alamin adenosyltransferase